MTEKCDKCGMFMCRRAVTTSEKRLLCFHCRHMLEYDDNHPLEIGRIKDTTPQEYGVFDGEKTLFEGSLAECETYIDRQY